MSGLSAMIKKLPTKSLNLVQNYVNRLVKREDLIKKRVKTYWNQRYEVYDQKVWPHMAEKELETHKEYVKTLEIPAVDLRWRSRYGNFVFKRYDPPKFFKDQTVLMSDYMMFNKFEIRENQIDRLLGFCRFNKLNDQSYQVDGWRFQIHDLKIPSYQIYYDDSNIKNIGFVVNDSDKDLVIRALLQIMNETPDNYLNFNNYHVLGEWFIDNNIYLQCHNINHYYMNMPKRV